MKIASILIMSALALCMLVTGCAKKEGVDTAKLEKSFATAEATTKTAVDKAVAAVKEGKYQEALAQLQEASGKADLTTEQQAAVKDVIAQIQTEVQKAAQQAVDDAKKKADDLAKSLGGK